MFGTARTTFGQYARCCLIQDALLLGTTPGGFAPYAW